MSIHQESVAKVGIPVAGKPVAGNRKARTVIGAILPRKKKNLIGKEEYEHEAYITH
jgi:hypothetical protein